MSDTATPPGMHGPWPVLDARERRVLGVLIEKQKTLSSEGYPMSLNALVTGCNQKSNRYPVMDLEEDDVEETLLACKNRGLVAKVVGGRVERWRHLLYEAWNVNKVEMAILGELLLRGPQTEGELRSRASRMDPIDDLDSLRSHLKGLAERKLVVYLTPEERRGAMVTHGFHDPAELSQERHRSLAMASAAPTNLSSTASNTSGVQATSSRQEERVTALETAFASVQQELEASRRKVASLEQSLAEMRQMVSATNEELNALKRALGA